MINYLMEILTCELCGAPLILNIKDTMDFYSSNLCIDSKTMFKSIDSIMSKVIVYRCSSCGQTYKNTYKDIEMLVRKKLTESALLYATREILSNVNTTSNKYFIYCGKCNGYDGQGCCPQEVFDKCEIKRFPIDVF